MGEGIAEEEALLFLLLRKRRREQKRKKSVKSQSPVEKNRRVRPSLSTAKIHLLKRVSFFEMNLAAIALTCSNCSGDSRKYLKIKDEEYLLY